MKTRTTQMSENLKSMKNLVKAYAEAEKKDYNARNERDLESARAEMKKAYNEMVQNLRELISDINVLGTSCGEMNIRDYFVLHTQTL